MTRTIACPENCDLLACAAGDDSSPNVRSHVESCPRCRRAVQRLKREISYIRFALAPDPRPASTALVLRTGTSGG